MTDSEAREMARGLVRGSIIEDAAAQFIAQVLKEAHDSRIKPMRDRMEELDQACAKWAEVSQSNYQRAKAAEAKLAKAVEGLKKCVDEIDAYIQFEYPSDDPVHERYRKRDYAANPARIALAELELSDD